MTDLLNSLADGWLALPVLEALEQNGVLRALERAPDGISARSLAQACAANEGQLRVALRMLLELGWLVQLANEHYGLTPGVSIRIPADAGALIRLSLPQLLGEPAGHELRYWLERSAGGWENAPTPMATCLDGALLAPLLITLEQAGGAQVLQEKGVSTRGPATGLSSAVLEALRRYFEQRAWGYWQGNGFCLSDVGRALLEGTAQLRVSLAWQFLPGRLQVLLFGDASSVHGSWEEDAGSWPAEYLAAFESAVLARFDQQPLEQQPRYLVDVGCSDGTLLRRLYLAIASHCRRGQQLERYPLLLIGVTANSNQHARGQQTLEGLPHLLLTGDIGDPQGLQASLGDNGIRDPENILYIHAFQEHRRAWQSPASTRGVDDQRHARPSSVHVDRNGACIESAAALQGLVEHLARWKELTSPHGLILLTAHCLHPATARQHARRSGAVHLDASHGFAGHQMFEAPVFLMAAAQAGLIAHRAAIQMFPRGESFTQVSLNRLLPRRYRIRHPLPRDLPRLRELELACWPSGLGATEAVLQRRLELYPQGQLVLEYQGQIVAAIYSQRLAAVEQLHHSDCFNVEALHDPDGPVAQLLGICVYPEHQGEGLADELIDFTLVYLASLDGVRSVVGVTRCHHYNARQADASSLEDYIRRRDETSGRLVEPMLCFHESHGAQVREVLEGYRPGDAVNRNAGVLVEYPDVRAMPPPPKTTAAPSPAVPSREWSQVVGQLLLGVLGEARVEAYGEHVPLMEMGLTSLQMLDLRHRLAECLASPLPATFFFQHGTPAAIIAYLQNHSAPAHGQTRHAPPPAAEPAPCAPGPEGIAIVGVGCRFPGGASSPERFWSLLQQGIDAVGQRGGLDDEPANGGFIEGAQEFDPRFFRISPREAQLLDPRQRLLLETAWEALEQAAIAPSSLRGSSTGVFVGLMGHGYDLLLRQTGQGHESRPAFTTGNAASVAAGRLAYFFDWHGPALSVDTACSSSLVAIHLACESLLGGKCEVALAGGVNLLLDQAESEAFRAAGMLSPRGRCSTFDEAADGYVRSEGCGLLVLKRHADALAAGDPIWAVIRGSAINHDGASAGLTVPNQSAQRAVIEAALAQAGLAPHQVQYLEAHGTGTRLGDPIEVHAAAQALGAGRQAQRPLLLGSVKTQIGHLEAAAGVAGLIKVILAMGKGQIPGQLHFRSPNPQVDWANLPVQVVDQPRPWFVGRRIAGVSSFGFSGTNAHVLLEACEPPPPATENIDEPVLILLSARTRDSLLTSAERLHAVVTDGRFAPAQLRDIAYTLQVGREAMAHRLALLARSLPDLASKLAGLGQPGVEAGELWLGEVPQDHQPSADALADATQDRLQVLAQRWVQGAVVDWTQLYAAPLPRRVDLPTYPFARQLCSVLPGSTTGSITMERQSPQPHATAFAGGSSQPGLDDGKPRKLQLRVLEDGLAIEPPAPAEQAAPVAAQDSPMAAQPGAATRAPEVAPHAQAERRALLERELTTSLAAALFLDPGEIGLDHLFVDLGLDSVIGVEWVRDINRRYGLALNAPVVYEHSSVRRMAALVEQALQPKMPIQVQAPPASLASQRTIPRAAASPEPLAQPETAPIPAATASRTAGTVTASEGIAIIGMSGRYPGAPTLDAYWDNLVAGRDCVEEIPPTRWSVDDYYDPEAGKPGKTYSKWLGRLDDIDCFDPLFFNISPAEAEWIDPQQRLFLEEGYKAFEDAGYPPQKLSDARCGVYLGIMGPSEYGWLAQQQRGAAEITGRSEAIAAARLAYFLNLKGPALLVDTACSSSLVATHLACQALRGGEVDVALVGGATLYLSPEMYMSMCKAGMLSPTGRCRTLDNAADGIVPGEGVGALVLKRLADAERDGDRIHGVIVASGINQDGKTNGITAPSASSQIALEREVYARHGIDPRSISYVELHGTGTKLGDPIELTALDTVFRERTEQRNFCGLGSVKSNIGHTTAAAGVAGVHKVLLQMRHRELAPTLHFNTPNEHFDFARSPFFVNTRHQSWQVAAGQPLRAAVSAFGISGTNAHVVIDAYQPAVAPLAAEADAPALLVLSAQRADRLQEYAKALLQFIEQQPRLDLAALAYSLQTGRAALEQRLAFVATSLAQVREALGDFISGTPSACLLSGEVATEQDTASVLAGEEEFQQLLASLLDKRRLQKLAELWVRGVEIDWSRLYGADRPRRLSLPTYPFARERYWVAPQAATGSLPDERAILHPLLHCNSSTLHDHRYSTQLSGNEWFVREHRVAGQPVVPGVVQLEWARAAAALARELPVRQPMVLEEVAWLRPLVVNQPLLVHISLVEEPGRGVRYEIHSGTGTQKQLYSQGWVRPASGQPAPRVDLAAVGASCKSQVDATSCYSHFAEQGLEYGAGFRALKELRSGPQAALASLSVANVAQGYTLPPSLLDGALQAATGWLAKPALQLPFAVARVEQWGPVPDQIWAVVRRASGEQGAGQSFDVDLAHADGQVAVRLSGFCCRTSAQPRLAGELTLAPCWQALEDVRVIADAQDHHLLEVPEAIARQWGTPDGAAACASWLGARSGFDHLLWHVPQGQPGVARIGLQLVQALLALDYGSRPLALTVVTRQALPVVAGETGDPEQASVHGLIGSVAKEYSHWQVRVLDLAGQGTWPSAQAGPDVPELPGETLALRDGQWYRQRLVPCVLPDVVDSALRERGVYLILGGAGGLGMVFSEYLIRRYQAQVIWLGRREADAAIEAQRARLGSLGPMPLYLRADANDRAALEAAEQTVRRRYGAVHGVVHAAIVLEDRGVAQMAPGVFDAALRAKAATSENLDAVFGRQDLDFMLFFSSMQSFIRTPGQANYAAGCCYADAFALGLRERPYPVKIVNWGYWGSVGIVAKASYRQRMEAAGIGSIEAPQAMALLERLLASPLPQLAFFKALHAQAASQWAVADDRQLQISAPVAPVILNGNSSLGLPQRVAPVLAELERSLAQLLRNLLVHQGWEHGTAGLAPAYVGWREDALRLLDAGGHAQLASDWPGAWRQWEADRERLLQGPDQAVVHNQIRLLDTVLPALPGVLRAERAATGVLFPGGSVERVEGIYRGHPLADYFNAVLAEQLLAYVSQRLAADPEARLRIIEIGAGTGGTSALLFQHLAPYAQAIDEYCYTDVSEAFLAHGREQYGEQASYLRTDNLDIERDPRSQGFEPGHYDVVIAANVLHATRDIRRTLRHVKSLLRGNGLLLLNELTQASLFTHLTFGLLDGWRMATDIALRVPGTPALAPSTWGHVLALEGYGSLNQPAVAAHGLGQQIVTGISDGVIESQVEAVQESGGSVARVTRPASPAPSPHQTDLAHECGMQVRQAIHEALFEVLKLDHARMQDDQAFANYGVDSITGITLINALNQKLDLRLPVTALFDFPSIRALAAYIQRTYPFLEQQTSRAEAPVSRLPVPPVTGTEPSGRLAPASAEPARVEVLPLAEVVEVPQVCWQLRIEGPGRIDQLQPIEAPLLPLGPNEVRIAVRAFALNFGDLLCVGGLYPTQPPYPFTPGFEASGVVLEVGAEVSRVAVGDAVFALAGEALGAHASVMTCTQDRVFALPAGLSFEEACALPVVAWTMIASFARAQVKPGEKVLIQTATGGTGLIAVQLAQHAGAEIYATAGSQEKLDYLAGLGVAHRINYREEDFEQAVSRLTQGQGVDVVINTLAGDAIQKGFNCLAPGGRYVELAMTALMLARSIDLSRLNDNQSFISIDLRKQTRDNPMLIQELADEMTRLLEAGVIRPTLSRVFDFSEVQDAYRWLADRRNIGKVVVRVPQTTAVPKRAPQLTSEPGRPEPIAVIGMSGRFASADSLNDLWQVLIQGQDLFEDVTRWDLSRYFPAYAPYCRRGGFLRDIDCFDPLFFNISGREAKVMDPQQRLFLQEAWRALEDAGYAGASGEGLRCGVYVGCAAGDYQRLLEADAPAQAFWGNAGSVIPARIAYHLNLQGPAVAIDTACSSSLVALHQACQGLRTGDADLALAGGVFVQSTELFHLQAQQAGMLSPSGCAYAFDAKADGFVPGEGVGAIVLKRLSQALADGDVIHGVIRGTGVNQDGASNGITAPNAAAQTRLELEVYRRHDIKVEHIGLVEAHGTATVLGDPIEARALADAFAQAGHSGAPCALGSIKSTVGHTATAAGIAGVLKVLLALRHRQIPASAHFVSANPHIDFSHGPFHVPTCAEQWHRPVAGERLAAVSSFGFSGTNAHAVIAEAPERWVRPSTSPLHLMVLSARTVGQLRQQAKNLLAHLQREPVEPGAMSHTLLLGRRHLEQRLAWVTSDTDALRAQLGQWLDAGELVDGYSGTVDGTQDASTKAQAVANQCLQDSRVPANPEKLRSALLSLAQLYVEGIELDWSRLFQGQRPGRVALPTYPFEKERYWPSGKEQEDREADVQVQPAPRLTEPPAALATMVQVSASKPAAATQTKPDRLKLRSLVQDLEALDSIAPDVAPPEQHVPTPQLRPLRAIAEPEDSAIVTVELQPETLQAVAEPVSVAVTPAQESQQAPGFDRYSLERDLSESLARALGIDVERIQADKPFASMGMDSIIAVEWSREINRRYGLALGATAVYKHPTLAGITTVVATELETNAPSMAASPVPQSIAGQDTKVVLEPEPRVEQSVQSPHEAPDQAVEGIAIIGMAGRYPGADSLEAYWDNLAAGRDCVEEIPASRWDVSAYFDADARGSGKIYSKWLGSLDDIDCFDPLFFRIPPLEAELMDPQQRLFLEEGYKAFENAGYGPRLLSESRCGVYLGMMGGNEYGEWVQHCQGAGDFTGSSPAIAAARLAYFLNLKGPALMVDTACSSSLVATHLACQALRSGEIDMALAGGVTLYLAPQAYLAMCNARVLSAHGRCRTLDNDADGFVPGEGVGALVLKRLGDAIRDGDFIHGVITGSGINQDGKTNGITAPSGASQEELLREVYARYGIDPETISYVELHGTGTKLGDPIEMEALSTVFQEHTQRQHYCGLGSVKSNLGHTSAAAGVAGLHKVLLQMKHRELVPTLHYRTPNEHLDLQRSPFFVCTARQPWQPGATPGLRAAVSAFGISGTNAHLVVDEYRPAPCVKQGAVPGPQPWLFVLSARRPEQLRSCAERLLAYVERDAAPDLEAMAYTLQTGRAELEYRLAFVADSRSRVLESLQGFIDGQEVALAHTGQARKAMSATLAGEDLLAGPPTQDNLQRLGSLWVGGTPIEWLRLYRGRQPRRLPLPTYPFARESHWAQPDDAVVRRSAAVSTTLPAKRLHPLIERNTSSIAGLRYSTWLAPEDELVRDCYIAGQPGMPAIVLLEWARAAVLLAQRLPADSAVTLQDVHWLQPLLVAGALEVHLELAVDELGHMRFRIFSQERDSEVLYCTGTAWPQTPTDPPAPRIDLARLREVCNASVTGQACYADLERGDVAYGSGLRALREFRRGTRLALGELHSPDASTNTGWPEAAVLVTGFQVAEALLPGAQALVPPFRVARVQRWGALPRQAWVSAVPSMDNSQAQPPVDIDLADDEGRLYLRLQGLSLGEPASLDNVLAGAMK
ncbi:KR domain-containing protein [Pseudomonas aeruginosa]|uniref:GNAT family N-acetyltransferase n=1 Tax=Pseudomonas aeruginosa TaxID=287 RepID=UPI000F61E9AE|nr:GNAT family N-acetyltransferase [Pseudomonas aeruginosa]RRH95025.1 KR domain-containing protein [Pseudomonas aeruginosa]RRI05067.1 KR domain-containing protein [Pseudomonas aeruginosa]